MPEPITAKQIGILQLISKKPKISIPVLLAVKGVLESDIAYLKQNDLVREREAGCLQISHLGEMVLKRS